MLSLLALSVLSPLQGPNSELPPPGPGVGSFLLWALLGRLAPKGGVSSLSFSMFSLKHLNVCCMAMHISIFLITHFICFAEMNTLHLIMLMPSIFCLIKDKSIITVFLLILAYSDGSY